MESEIGRDHAGEPSFSAEPGSGGGPDGNEFAPVDSAPPTETAEAVQPGAPLPPGPPAQPGPAYGQPPMPPGPGYGQQPPGHAFGQPQMPPMPPGAPFGYQQPYGSYGYPPVGYPPNGYPPYGYNGMPPRRGLDGTAVASLVLGICGFLFITPVIGLILGIVALATIKRTGRRGKGQAIAGIVLSSLWITVFGIIITAAVLLIPDPPQRDANGTVVKAGTVPVFNLHTGDCFTVPASMKGTTDAKTRTIKVVPCSTPHDAEDFGSFDASDDSYPGLSTLRTEAVGQCVKILDTYLPDPASLPAGTRVDFIFGNQQSWDLGERKVECFAHFASPTVTASVAGSEADYTPDQLRFLKAVQPVASAVSVLNATPQSSPLNVLQDRATDVADGLQSEITTLTQAPWSPPMQPVIDSLVAQDRITAQLWAQASGTNDTSTFWDTAEKANASYDLQDLKDARTALGLKTVAGGDSGDAGGGVTQTA